MQGIEKRTNKDGSFTYRARVRIKGHSSISESFNSLTLAKKWKRNTESAIEQGRFQFSPIEKKYTLSELVDRYIETICQQPRKRPIWRSPKMTHLAVI